MEFLILFASVPRLQCLRCARWLPPGRDLSQQVKSALGLGLGVGPSDFALARPVSALASASALQLSLSLVFLSVTISFSTLSSQFSHKRQQSDETRTKNADSMPSPAPPQLLLTLLRIVVPCPEHKNGLANVTKTHCCWRHNSRADGRRRRGIGDRRDWPTQRQSQATQNPTRRNPLPCCSSRRRCSHVSCIYIATCGSNNRMGHSN